jgi:hypothetical protein
MCHKCQGYGSTTIALTINHNLGAVPIGDGFDDRQAKPGAVLTAKLPVA